MRNFIHPWRRARHGVLSVPEVDEVLLAWMAKPQPARHHAQGRPTVTVNYRPGYTVLREAIGTVNRQKKR